MFLPFHTSELRNNYTWDELGAGPVGKPKEVRVKRERFPKQGKISLARPESRADPVFFRGADPPLTEVLLVLSSTTPLRRWETKIH